MARPPPTPTRFSTSGGARSSSSRTSCAIQGGVIVSDFEWVQDLQRLFWSEAEVNDKLETLLKASFEQVLRRAKRDGVSNRTGRRARQKRRDDRPLGISQVGFLSKARAAIPPPGGRGPHGASRSGFSTLLESSRPRPLNPSSHPPYRTGSQALVNVEEPSLATHRPASNLPTQTESQSSRNREVLGRRPETSAKTCCRARQGRRTDRWRTGLCRRTLSARTVREEACAR